MQTLPTYDLLQAYYELYNHFPRNDEVLQDCAASLAEWVWHEGWRGPPSLIIFVRDLQQALQPDSSLYRLCPSLRFAGWPVVPVERIWRSKENRPDGVLD